MTTSKSPQMDRDLVESLKDCWLTFRREYDFLKNELRITPEDEESLQKTKDALLLRFRRTQKDSTGNAMSDALKNDMNRLADFASLGNLTDAQLQSYHRLMRDIEEGMGGWLAAMRRHSNFRHKALDQGLKAELDRFVKLPIVFAVLIGLFLFIGIRFYLNR